MVSITYIPETREEFSELINNAPWWVLLDMGFRRYGVMNDIIMKLRGVPLLNKRGSGEGLLGEYIDGEGELILFPSSFIGLIPDDLMVRDIFGRAFLFGEVSGSTMSMEVKDGNLSYGIIKDQQYFD